MGGRRGKREGTLLPSFFFSFFFVCQLDKRRGRSWLGLFTSPMLVNVKLLTFWFWWEWVGLDWVGEERGRETMYGGCACLCRMREEWIEFVSHISSLVAFITSCCPVDGCLVEGVWALVCEFGKGLGRRLPACFASLVLSLNPRHGASVSP